jgi:hypothetical protein
MEYLKEIGSQVQQALLNFGRLRIINKDVERHVFQTA